MTHSMTLATEYFEKIKNGTKTIECRLYDEKRKLLKIGDIIEFINAQNADEKIDTEIMALHVFPSFSDLIDHFSIIKLGGENKEQFISVLKKFYSNEDEKKFEVVGIEVKLI
jgi:ASC-1-like (ASCH) protein